MLWVQISRPSPENVLCLPHQRDQLSISIYVKRIGPIGTSFERRSETARGSQKPIRLWSQTSLSNRPTEGKTSRCRSVGQVPSRCTSPRATSRRGDSLQRSFQPPVGSNSPMRLQSEASMRCIKRDRWRNDGSTPASPCSRSSIHV